MHSAEALDIYMKNEGFGTNTGKKERGKRYEDNNRATISIGWNDNVKQ